MTPHDDMIATWKKDLAFRQAYDALAEEFALFDALVSARQRAGLTQMEVAERMGTSRSQIARLLDPKDGNVTINTLQRAAKVVGRSLRLELV